MTQQQIETAARELSELFFGRGYPTRTEAFVFTAEFLTRFAQTVRNETIEQVTEAVDVSDNGAHSPDWYDGFDAALNDIRSLKTETK